MTFLLEGLKQNENRLSHKDVSHFFLNSVIYPGDKKESGITSHFYQIISPSGIPKL
jgi:hypothetical protein